VIPTGGIVLERIGSCHRCGHCCRGVFLNFGMGHAATQEERDCALDFLRWASFHEGVIVNQIDEDNAEVGFDAPCRHLTFDKDGKSSCGIYEVRPRICRDFPSKPSVNCPGFRFKGSSETSSEKKEVYDEQG